MGCDHRPPCPTSACRWKCSRRTEIEQAIVRGLFSREDAFKLLEKYGVPLTPASRVYRGQPLTQKRLL